MRRVFVTSLLLAFTSLAAWSQAAKPTTPPKRTAAPAASGKSISTYGLVAAKATTASVTPIARRLQLPQAAAASGARAPSTRR